MPTIKPNKSEIILGKIFKNTSAIYGLKEFESFDLARILIITEEEPHKFYVKDLKSGVKKFVYDDKKQAGKTEEIIRQLWIYKLNKHYKYPLERIDTEKSIHFGRELT